MRTPRPMTPKIDAGSSERKSDKLWSMLRTLWDVLSTTALSKCWPVLIWTGIWSSVICFLNHYTHGKLSIETTLVTVFGTVLGFVISFRTTSSFDRYNDGRKCWSQIVLNCRIFARTVWFHVPDNAISSSRNYPVSDQEKHEAMTLIEKKTVVNLLEAYAVAVKHYLRGEDGIDYEDLYPLAPFLYSCYYPFPAIIPAADLRNRKLPHGNTYPHHPRNEIASPQSTLRSPASPTHAKSSLANRTTKSANSAIETAQWPDDIESQMSQNLLPAELPPMDCWRSAFPFPLLGRIWAAMTGDAQQDVQENFPPRKNNVPLEISLYLTSYISALQGRKVVDDPTLNLLYTTLNQLVEALTELERVLSTPIPVSYTSHLWMITTVYCGTLPFQLWTTFEWFTVPACVIASLVFFGFIVAGEEIENPFGYDKNDLDMGYFVEKIIRKELHAITTTQAPDPAKWAFALNNDFLQVRHPCRTNTAKEPPSAKEVLPVIEPPEAWVRKGKAEILRALHSGDLGTKPVGLDADATKRG